MSEKKVKDPLLDDESRATPDKPAKTPKVEATVETPKTLPQAPEAVIKDEVANTKAILDRSPHINFLIPLADGEKAGAFDTVQINGYLVTVPKGEMVNIPVQVANILAEKYKIGMTAGQNSRVDRASDVQDALG